MSELRAANHPEDGHPLGWPCLAAWQQQYRNADCFRAFNYSGLRIIQYKASRLAFLEAKLLELDREGNGHLRNLTDYQKRLPGQPTAQNKYDAHMAELAKAWDEYSTQTIPRTQHLLMM